MNYISKHIDDINQKNRKALTIFLTSGFPDPDKFVDMAINISNAGADILEIGLPFGDSLADGPTVQSSYIASIEKGINLETTLKYIYQIKKAIKKPLILMSSANPILYYGLSNFADAASESGVDGLIIPDVPLEEYEDFFDENLNSFDKILLTTPTSPKERIKDIDEKSSGFVYCVSVVGTTGVRNKFDNEVFENLKRTYSIVQKNKMQIGFGISNGDDIKKFSPYCDGVIVGSAIIKSLRSEAMLNNNYEETLRLVKELRKSC